MTDDKDRSADDRTTHDPTSRPDGGNAADATRPIDRVADDSATAPYSAPVSDTIPPEAPAKRSRMERVRATASKPWVPVAAIAVGAALVGAIVTSAIFVANPVHEDVSTASSNSALPASGGQDRTGGQTSNGQGPDGQAPQPPNGQGPGGAAGPGGPGGPGCAPGGPGGPAGPGGKAPQPRNGQAPQPPNGGQAPQPPNGQAPQPPNGQAPAPQGS